MSVDDQRSAPPSISRDSDHSPHCAVPCTSSNEEFEDGSKTFTFAVPAGSEVKLPLHFRLSTLAQEVDRNVNENVKEIHVRAPSFTEEIRSEWLMLVHGLGSNTLLLPLMVVGEIKPSSKRKFEVHWRALVEKGLYVLQVQVKSLDYLGSDTSFRLGLNVI